MTLTHARSNGTQWTVSFASWQFISAICAVVALSMALATPWVDWRAATVIDAKEAAALTQIKVNTERLTRVEEQSAEVKGLTTQRYDDLKADIRDLRSDIRSVREILADGKRR